MQNPDSHPCKTLYSQRENFIINDCVCTIRSENSLAHTLLSHFQKRIMTIQPGEPTFTVKH